MKLRAPRMACTGLAALALCACGPEDSAQENTQAAPELEAGQKSNHFDAVSAHLDLGGEAYGYLDVDGDAEKLAEALQGLLEFAKEAGGDEVPPQLAALKIESIIADLGLTGIEAMGMSSYKNGALYHNKFYLHTPAGRNGVLKLLGGEAGPFVTKSLAPAGSDLVMEQQLDLKSAFALVRDLVGKIGGPEAAREFANVTSEPMAGGPPLSIADVFGHLDTRLSLIARVHPDQPMQLPPDVPFKVPGIDAMIALDNLGPLVVKVLESIPADQREGMIEEGDGFQQMAIPAPPELAAMVQPVIRHDIASGRIFVGTSPAFLAECLAGGSSVWDDGDFKTATQGLPTEGNGFSFVSSEFMAEYMRVYGEAMDSVADTGGADGFGEAIVGLMQTMGMSPDHAQAGVITNLPEGMLMVQNSTASAKQTIMMSGAAFVGMGTSAFFVPMAYSDAEMSAPPSPATPELRSIEPDFVPEPPKPVRPAVPLPIPVEE